MDKDLQKQIEALPPELRETYEKAPPDFRKTLLRVYLGSIEREAENEAKEIMAKIDIQPQQTWLPCCPLPTPLARTSPFFPIAQQKMSDRTFFEDTLISDNPWGTIVFTGPKLSTFDEDVLFAILALIDSSKNIKTVETELGLAYLYRGQFQPLLDLMRLKNSGQSRERIKRALKRLMASVVEINFYERTGKRSGKKRKVTRHVAKNMLMFYDWNKEDRTLSLTINPYFREMYLQERITKIDVLRRSEIRSPISKALFRFIQSHREPKWKGHFLTLSRSLNLDLEQQDKQLRRQIKTAINDLTKREILTQESTFEGRDIVVLIRHPSAMLKFKELPKSTS